jgi:hypothetical protein
VRERFPVVRPGALVRVSGEFRFGCDFSKKEIDDFCGARISIAYV